ncbi:MAG: class I SAM-dependent methyltransferase [bacterium]|nr:class I SAM-dependent methyltransferase [bacterium]MBU1918565.1 class I SAM-dependent methyltransferase [bacterium]
MTQVNKVIFDINKLVEPCYKAQNKAFGPIDFPYIKELFAKHKIKNVLDVGTGEGSFILELANQTKGVKFDAVDINPDLIEIAKKRKGNINVTFENAHFNSAFSGNNYDLIMARFAVEHMSNVSAFLKTVKKKLKSQGYIFIIEYYVDEMHATDSVWKEYRKKELAVYRHIKSHPRVSLKLPGSLKRAGFKNIESSFRHISPATVGATSFYNLVREYSKIYHHIAPSKWSKNYSDKIIKWAKISKKRTNNDPTLIITHTIGQKL